MRIAEVNDTETAAGLPDEVKPTTRNPQPYNPRPKTPTP
jgi:hypothetical protein